MDLVKWLILHKLLFIFACYQGLSVLTWFITAVVLTIGLAYGLKRFRPPPAKSDGPTDGWYGPGDKKEDDTSITPFEVKVADETLLDLKNRLKQTRINHETLEDADTFEYGFNVNYLKKVRDYWLNDFDWRKQEATLNSFPQFTTEIEGIKVHFYHVKPNPDKYKKILPLLVVHGWPGCVFEFYKFIPMLTDPAAYNLGFGDFAFEVVAPSIPGFGYSSQPRKTGFGQFAAARIFGKLMLRLGHEKFYLQGGDWGSSIVRHVARQLPENVCGLHTNFMTAMIGSSKRTTLLMLLGSYFPRFLFSNHPNYDCFRNIKLLIAETGYMHIQATKPDTIGTALNDSPLGLAAYILEKFSTWTNASYRELPDGGLTKKFTLDELLTIITIYWTQGNIVSSQRFYKELYRDANNSRNDFIIVPCAHAQCEHELFDREPKEILSEYCNLVSQKSILNAGHFAAFEEPKALAEHFFSFVSDLQKQ